MSGALVLLTGCAAAAGAVAGAAVLTTVVLTAGCYDSVEVTVRDAVTGMPSCNASVVARSPSGSTTRFNSCFYAQVPVGKWTVLAERPGYRPMTTELIVDDRDGCRPSLQTIEIWLTPATSVVPAPPAVAPGVAPPAVPPPAPPPVPAPPAVPPAPPAAPATPPNESAPAPPAPAEFPLAPPVAPAPPGSASPPVAPNAPPPSPSAAAPPAPVGPAAPPPR